MSKTKISRVIEKCEKLAPNENCEDCKCNEIECVECLREVLNEVREGKHE